MKVAYIILWILERRRENKPEEQKVYLSVFLRSEKTGKGSIIGFTYGEDSTTPLDGAIVKFLNVTTDAVNATSSGISFSTLTQDSENIMKSTCPPNFFSNWKSLKEKIINFWQQWWSHCDRGN